MAGIVETEPIDDGPRLNQAEDARPRIACLWLRRDGAHLGKAESHVENRIGHPGVLVEPRSDPEGVGELEPPHALRQLRRVRPLRARVEAPLKRRQRGLVRALRIKREEKGPCHVENGAQHRLPLFTRSASGRARWASERERCLLPPGRPRAVLTTFAANC